MAILYIDVSGKKRLFFTEMYGTIFVEKCALFRGFFCLFHI